MRLLIRLNKLKNSHRDRVAPDGAGIHRLDPVVPHTLSREMTQVIERAGLLFCHFHTNLNLITQTALTMQVKQI